MRKLSTQEIDKKVKAVHKDRVYIDWNSSGEYSNNKQKVVAIDKDLGSWDVSIDKLIQGRGHPKRKEQRLKSTQEEIDSKIKIIHKGLVFIDWTKTPTFENKAKQKIIAVDRDFGPWEIKVGDLLKGINHRKRYYLNKTLTKEEINERVNKIFKGQVQINWQGIETFTTKTKVEAIDKEYGSWTVVISKLLLGVNHPLRSRKSMADGKLLTIAEINERIEKIHLGNVKIDWDKTGEYVSNEQKVIAEDKNFGVWEIKMHNLLRGQGHLERFLAKVRLTREEIDGKILKIFKDDVKIDWNKTGVYKKNSQKVVAVHKTYGEWEIKLNHLLKGVNHPKDSPSSSKGEKELYEWLLTEGLIVEPRKMFIFEGKRKELDCYLPDFNIGVEYHGLYWHSEIYTSSKSHLEKREFFEKQNIKVLQFFENEWLMKKDIVKSLILSRVGKAKEKYNARELTVNKVTREEAQRFLDNNHLMGKYLPATYYGLYNDKNILLSLIGIQNKKGTLEISRFCNLNGVIVRGGFSKLLTHCERIYSPTEVLSFVDLRYGDGKSLELNGFKKESVTLGWNWTDCYDIYNRRYCRANMDERKMTEQEHAAEQGLLKIYDAGQAKFIKTLTK